MYFSLYDVFAITVFVSSWVGYHTFAKSKAKHTNCIARCLHQHRVHWMYEIITREVRVGEAAILANLERNIAFFASSTLLVLAGVLTLFAQVSKLESVIASLPFAREPHHFLVQLNLTLLSIIFVSAFFQFTWSMRQYGFVNVMVGAAPIDISGKNENLKRYAEQVAIVQDQAAHSYNHGLRSYYFSLAAISWLVHPLAFASASIAVVVILYKREFNSKAVKAITAGKHFLDLEREAKEHHIN